MPSWLEIKKCSVFSARAVCLPTLLPQSLVFCFTSLTKATLPLTLILDLLFFSPNLLSPNYPDSVTVSFSYFSWKPITIFSIADVFLNYFSFPKKHLEAPKVIAQFSKLSKDNMSSACYDSQKIIQIPCLSS